MLNLRKAELSDADAFAQLVSALGYPTDAPQMAARLPALLAHPDYRTVVATLEDRVVGLIGFQLALRYETPEKYVRILILATDASVHGKGIGSALVAEAEKFAKTEGARMLVVNSGLHRDTAHGFYVGRGFEKLGYGFYKSLAP